MLSGFQVGRILQRVRPRLNFGDKPTTMADFWGIIAGGQAQFWLDHNDSTTSLEDMARHVEHRRDAAIRWAKIK